LLQHGEGSHQLDDFYWGSLDVYGCMTAIYQ